MRYPRSFSVCTRKCAHLAIHLLPSLRFGCSLLSNLGWCLRKMRALHPHICLWLTSHMDVKRSWWFVLCKHWNVERISNSIHSYPCFSIFIHCYPVLSCTTRVSHPGNQADCGRASVSLGLLASTKCCQLSTKDGLQAYWNRPILYIVWHYIYIMILNNIISYHVSYIIYIWYVIYYILYIIYYILYFILYIYIIIYYMLYIIYYIL